MVKVPVLALALVAWLLGAAMPASAEPPPNDDFESAALLRPSWAVRDFAGPVAAPPGGAVSTHEATRQSGEPLHAGLPTTQTVWFKYATKRTHRILVYYPQFWRRKSGWPSACEALVSLSL